MEKELTKIILPIGQDSKELIHALQKANFKNFVVLRTIYEGLKSNYQFNTDDQPIEIMNDKFFKRLENGNIKLTYEGPWDDYLFNNNGQLIVIIDDKFFEVLEEGNTKLIYQGPWDDLEFDDNGQLLIRIDDMFIEVLEEGNTKLIYQGPWDDFEFDNGQLTINIGNSFYTVDFLCIEPTK